VTPREVSRTIEAVWHIESARLIAGLARLVRDIGLAEDLAQEALVAALEQWPESGVPDNPGAWLMAPARHRAIDRLRRGEVLVEVLRTQMIYLLTRYDEATFVLQPAVKFIGRFNGDDSDEPAEPARYYVAAVENGD
jgi:predicted RNA polymerase sigma factor